MEFSQAFLSDFVPVTTELLCPLKILQVNLQLFWQKQQKKQCRRDTLR